MHLGFSIYAMDWVIHCYQQQPLITNKKVDVINEYNQKETSRSWYNDTKKGGVFYDDKRCR